MVKVKLDELENRVAAGVEKLGYRGDDAKIIAETLMYAQLRGNNQGIAKIATGGVPDASDVEPFELVKENKAGALYSGGHSMVSTMAICDKAKGLAEAHGIGIVGLNRTHTSSGAIGYFARQLAKDGYIALITVGNGDWGAVAPLGSSEAKLGTNPICYAFPYDGGEVVFDTATAAIAFYGVMQSLLSGEPLPEGVAVDAEGKMTTNAADVIKKGDGESVGGAIRTFGGMKGYGFSIFVQLLGSAFTLAGFPGAHGEDGGGTCVIAIDPGLLAGKEEYMKRSRELVESIKSSRPIPGKSVMLPGEHGDELTRKARDSGEIEIPDGVWTELVKFLEDN